MKECNMAKGGSKSSKSSSKAPNIRPLGAKVLLKRLEAEQTTKGGIVLPDTAKEKPQQGTVLAVGDGKLLDDGSRADFQVSVGNTVLFSSYAGTEIKYQGETYLLMDESDILAVMD
jgi:chaperonin GroES